MMTCHKSLDIASGISGDFGYWLAGFVDGEGCFVITAKNGKRQWHCSFRVKLRADDRPILETCQRITQAGTVILHREKGKNKQYIWAVGGIKDLFNIIVPLFEKYKLRTKKAQDFELFAKAVRLIYSKQHLTESGAEELRQLKSEMELGRKYNNIL